MQRRAQHSKSTAARRTRIEDRLIVQLRGEGLAPKVNVLAMDEGETISLTTSKHPCLLILASQLKAQLEERDLRRAKQCS